MTSERDKKRKEHESLRKQRLDEFMVGFSTITTKLKEMYQVRYLEEFSASNSVLVWFQCTFVYNRNEKEWICFELDSCLYFFTKH